MKTVLIDDETHSELTKIKKATGVPIVETIRRAIDEYLERQKATKCNN